MRCGYSGPCLSWRRRCYVICRPMPSWWHRIWGAHGVNGRHDRRVVIICQEGYASSLAAASLLFAVMMACLAVVAGTWDTPHRVSAIAWMGTGFLALAVIALLYRSRLVRAQLPFLATVKGEWQEDRLILNRVLSTGED